MKNIAVLISGSGTNLERIIEGIASNEIPNTKICMVVADRPCYGLERAKKHGIPQALIPRGKTFSENLAHCLPKEVDLIVLAGFLSILPQKFITLYPNKIINIHPSLLPKFGGKGMWGMHVHNAVIAAQESESGATVHYVTAGIDEGDIILQKKVDITTEDTPESLAQKIHEVEYQILPKAISQVLNS